jgi:transcription elongation factor GreA
MTDNAVPAKTITLTAEGLEELKKEHKYLMEEKLPSVVERVARARDEGDLSENSEYSNAREDQNLIEARITEIESILAKAQVVSQTRSHTKIGLGSQVVVTVKGKKKKLTFQICGDFEANPAEGKISVTSPLGKALTGKGKGDEVKVKAPAGEIAYVVEEIK